MFFFKKKQEKKNIAFQELLATIVHVIQDEESKKLLHFRQHLFFNRFEHSLNVARLSYRFAKLVKADPYTCALAGMLHDYHFTTIKSYSHAIHAAQNAKKFGVSDEVIQIIESHMYPFGRKHIKRAHGKNFWVVKAADFVAATFEMFYSLFSLSFRYDERIRLKKNKKLFFTAQKEKEEQEKK